MNGNEKMECLECKKPIEKDDKDTELLECDCCQQIMHKQCGGLSTSEIRVIVLQRRSLNFFCSACKTLMIKLPYMINMIERLQKNMDELKENIKMANQQNTTYANKTKLIPTTKEVTKNTQLETLIIKPIHKQDIPQTRKIIEKTIKPTELQIGIDNIRHGRDGTIIIKSATKQNIDKLKKEIEKKLSNKITTNIPKKKLPRIKIVGFTGTDSKEQIQTNIREQNTWIQEDDHFEITYVKKDRNKEHNLIYVECQPGIYWKLMQNKTVYIGWNRCTIYDDTTITRCFKCQDYYHKTTKCTNHEICGNCGEDHSTNDCQTQRKKCINCQKSNQTFNTKHNVNHTTKDPECPSTKYHLGILKSRIDYGDKW